MIRLFKRRMECSAEVAMYKKEHGLPVLDKKREKELIEKNAKAVKDGEIEGYYREFFDTMLSVSKKYQHRLLYGVKVAYSGIEGSFAAISAGKILPDAKRVPYKNFTVNHYLSFKKVGVCGIWIRFWGVIIICKML